MTRSQTQTILRELAKQHGCEYVQPDDDVLDMLVQFGCMVEELVKIDNMRGKKCV